MTPRGRTAPAVLLLSSVPLLLVLAAVLPGGGCAGPGQPPLTIGVARWASNPQYDRNIQGFKDGLSRAGFIEGLDVRYVVGNAEAEKKAQIRIVKGFLKERVDLIYSLTTPGTLVAKAMATETPIVFSVVTYPVEAGVVSSMDSSGSNLTGTRNYVPPLRQYLTFERLCPGARTLGFAHRRGEPNSAIQLAEFRRQLKRRGLEVVDLAATSAADLRGQLQARGARLDAVYAACDTLIQGGGGEEAVIDFSRRSRKPTFTCNHDGVRKGALIGDVADLYEIGKLSGEKAGLILKGAKPDWIPTEPPRHDSIMVNLGAAKGLGIAVPEDLLEDADHVVR